MVDKVSIVIPVYCVEKYINKCIESVIHQDYSNLEVLLIDDGSPDKSGAICDGYAENDQRINVIHKENGGVSSARNIGIENASGKYMMFVDGDDWLETDAVSRMIQCMSKKKLDVCFATKYYKDETNVIVQPLLFEIGEFNIPANKALIQHLRYRLTSSVCLAGYDLSVIGKIEFDTELHALEDWEYIFRILLYANSIGILDYEFYHYRTVVGSASKSKLNEKKMTCFLIPEKVRDCLKNNQLEATLAYAEGLEAILINHMMVINANSSIGNRSEYVKRLAKIARKSLLRTFRSKYVLKRLKFYCLIIAIHPAIFELLYKMKHRKENDV